MIPFLLSVKSAGKHNFVFGRIIQTSIVRYLRALRTEKRLFPPRIVLLLRFSLCF